MSRWSKCKVNGTIVACDPGIQTYSDFPTSHSRFQMKRGMNLLAGQYSYLPALKVSSIGEDHLFVVWDNTQYRVEMDKPTTTHNVGLSYAYAYAKIELLP